MNKAEIIEGIAKSKLIRVAAVSLHSLLQSQLKTTDEGFGLAYKKKRSELLELSSSLHDT